MKVEKIDHIAIQVKDIEKAGRLFADLLSTEFSKLGEIEEMDVKSIIDPLGIELLEPLTPDGVAAKNLQHRGEGFAILSLKVPNLKEAIAEMRSHGIRLVGRIEREKMRAAIFHPKDTYGVSIELIEYKVKPPLVELL